MVSGCVRRSDSGESGKCQMFISLIEPRRIQNDGENISSALLNEGYVWAMGSFSRR